MARFLMFGREWLSMAMSSGDISRASSGLTMWDSPSSVTAISAGVELKS